jgi:hypothetical protein
VARQIVEPVADFQKICFFIFALYNHNIQVLPLQGEVFLQLNPKAPIRQI